VRNLARVTWCSVGAEVWQHGRLDSSGKPAPAYRAGEYGEAEKREKVAALRMMVAFVIASKHHVRGEWGTDHEDLTALLPASFLKRFNERGYGYGGAAATAARGERPAFVQSPTSLSRQGSTTSIRTTDTANPTDGSRRETGSQQSSPHSSSSSNHHATAPAPTPTENSPLVQQVYDDTVIVHKLNGRPSLPLPLVIAHRLQLYCAKCKAQGLLESVGPAGYNAMTTAISQLVNEFTGMERLLTLPLPLVYGIHLKQTVTLYLAALPLVLVDTMKWRMIPFSTLIAFTLMGIEGIASEIESPFGYDASDLPLDFMCAELRNEIEQMIARLKEVPDDGIFS